MKKKKKDTSRLASFKKYENEDSSSQVDTSSQSTSESTNNPMVTYFQTTLATTIIKAREI